MCEPISLSLITLGLTAAGTAVGAVGNYMQGQAEGEAADFNAHLSDIQAGDARQRGEVEASRYRSAGTRMVAQQRVAAGASGIEGKSVEDLMLDTALMSERDAETVRNNAAREAWGYEVQAADLRLRGAGARSRGVFGAGGTILGGIASGLSMVPRRR